MRIECMLPAAASLLCAARVAAQAPAPVDEQLAALRAELAAQRAVIERQAARIEQQQSAIDALQARRLDSAGLQAARGTGLALQQAQPVPPVQPQRPPSPSAEPPPSAPVGEAPNIPTIEKELEAVPQGQGVLTPPGRLVIEPSVEYTNSSNNRLVFRGIELIPGIQIGVIEASDADRNTFAPSVSLRYGLTDRLEFEFRAPYLIRSDRIEVVQQRDGTIVRQIDLSERSIGDVEFAARYQLNRPVGQKPIYVASLRVKSDTGRSPFEIPYDDFGIATGLATGSGFWAVQPGVNILLPSDPGVLFGGAAYLYHLPKNIDQEIGGVLVGRVDPGDAVTANIGFGFALNPRFSYSLGYRHAYIFPTTTELGQTTQRSNGLQVGSLSLGLSYRVTMRHTVNLSFDFGITEDAPDLGLTLRVPFSWETR